MVDGSMRDPWITGTTPIETAVAITRDALGAFAPPPAAPGADAARGTLEYHSELAVMLRRLAAALIASGARTAIAATEREAA